MIKCNDIKHNDNETNGNINQDNNNNNNKEIIRTIMLKLTVTRK